MQTTSSIVTGVNSLQLCLTLLLFFVLTLGTTAPYRQDAIPSKWNTFEPNRWHSFDKWSPNSPTVRQYSAATAVLGRRTDGTSKEMMLLHGGESGSLDNRTWIYDPQSNSWSAVRQRSGPQTIVHHTLVTLCERRVFLFGGFTSRATSRNSQCSNETWVFEPTRKEWRLVETIVRPNDDDSYVTPRCRHTATVVRFENSSCSCKESMLIYSGLRTRHETWSSKVTSGLDDLWLLTCRDDKSHVYEWARLRPNGPKLNYPRAVSAFNNTIVYVFGVALTYGSDRYWEVWSYRLSTGTWHKHRNSTKRASVPGWGVYITTDHQSYHFLVSCCSQPLAVFDMIQEQWFSPQQTPAGYTPNLPESSVTIAKIGVDIFIFGTTYQHYTAKGSMRRLVVHSTGQWHWSKLTDEIRSPVRRRIFSLGGVMASQKEMLLFGGLRIGQDRAHLGDNSLHRLDLTTLKWSSETAGNQPPSTVTATATILFGSVMVVYGGLSPKVISKVFGRFVDSILLGGTWGYYNRERVWVRYPTKALEPPERILHASVAADTRTMMVYGGTAIDTDSDVPFTTVTRRDLWSFTLPPMYDDTVNLSAQKAGAQWRLIDRLGPTTSFAASLVALDNSLFMYGGSESLLPSAAKFLDRSVIVTINCSNSLWKYNLSDSSRWTEVHYAGSGPGRRCLHHALPFGDHMLVTGGCSHHAELRVNVRTYLQEFDCPFDPLTSGVWVYDPPTSRWLRLNRQSVYDSAVVGSSISVWKDYMLHFCGLPASCQMNDDQIPDDWIGFSVYKPACPPGTTSSNLKTRMCSNCDVGYYTALSNSNCSKCPQGLTTLQSGSTAKEECNTCQTGYCRYGTCTVALQGPSPTCSCQLGFTKGDQEVCTVPTYYIAASGFVAGVALLILVVALIAKFRKARKRHNAMLRSKDHQLMELTKTWNIDSREIRLRRRIDRDAPGGFGEVYKAEYREITVAVKKLQGIHQHIDRIELEFEREIEVMRTIRHPNIVLFLGGGRYHNDGCPFLVVEYMRRGSLAAVLRDDSTELEDSLKMRFALDAAKGLRFLHGQRPPRVHRDLKSGNLLVSQKWVVKVADFGAARLVRDEGIKQEAVRGEGPLNLTAPLLRADYQLSSGVGTPSWCAPEILCGDGYGTPADVYSFGIVMWEIRSRKVPYHDRRFRSLLDLKSAVLSGIRPTIYEGEQEEYVKLIRACWSGNTSCRPAFRDIVSKLEEINEFCFVVSSV